MSAWGKHYRRIENGTMQHFMLPFCPLGSGLLSVEKSARHTINLSRHATFDPKRSVVNSETGHSTFEITGQCGFSHRSGRLLG